MTIEYIEYTLIRLSFSQDLLSNLFKSALNNDTRCNIIQRGQPIVPRRLYTSLSIPSTSLEPTLTLEILRFLLIGIFRSSPFTILVPDWFSNSEAIVGAPSSAFGWK